MKYIGHITLTLVLGILIFLVADKIFGKHTNRIGVVQMEKLVYEFKGMKEATAKYTSKLDKWNAESDSLQSRLKQMYDQIKLDSLSNDKEKLNRDVKAFVLFRQSYVDYTQNMQANAENEDKQMTIGVVNQVNEYIKKFAEEKGYDIILCNSQTQSVGYAKEQNDITPEILAFANAGFEGNKGK